MAVPNSRKRSANVGHHNYGRLITLSDGTDAFVPFFEQVGPLSQFGEVLTTARTPIIELNSSYGVSAVRDVQTVANNGTIAASSGEIRLRTSVTANGSAQLESAEVGRYIPGYGAQIGIGVRIPADPSGNQTASWGGHTVDENDGFYFGMDSGGVYVARKDGNVELGKTYQSSWNLDTLDGTGESGITLNVADGTIFQIEFTWYGYGQILYGVLGVVNGQQLFVPCHSVRVTGGTSIESPNLNLFAKADNGGDESSFDLFVGGRQYSILGKYVPSFRFTGDVRTAVATTTTAKPIVSFRTKSAFQDRAVRVDGFTIKPATEDVIVEIRLDGALTSPSWGTPTNHTAAETALEVDKAASAIVGGTVIYSEFFEAGVGNRGVTAGSAPLDIEVPQGQEISLCVRTLSGTGTCLGFFRMKEEW